jgi:hypothetical protein
MIMQMMEDKQAFDDDLHEHLSITMSLQNMLDAKEVEEEEATPQRFNAWKK